jgi:hypothetical protein
MYEESRAEERRKEAARRERLDSSPSTLSSPRAAMTLTAAFSLAIALMALGWLTTTSWLLTLGQVVLGAAFIGVLAGLLKKIWPLLLVGGIAWYVWGRN